MKKQKGLLILCVALVLLMAGASVLYNYLGDKVERNVFLEENEGNNELISKEEDSNGEDSDEEVVEGEDLNGEVLDESVLNEEVSDGEDVDEAVSNGEVSDGEDADETVSNEEVSEGENTDETVSNEESSDEELSEESSEDDTSKENTQSLEPAKDFTVTDIDGNEVSLSDFKGKPVVLNFWASWCSICKNEMMDFEIIYNQYKDDVAFMIVNVTDGYRDTVKKASEYISKKGYSFPVYYDTMQEGYFAYNTMSVPATYFIDAEGNLVAKIKGGVDRVILEQGIAKIYSEE